MTSNPPPPKAGQAQTVFPDIDETTMQQRSDVLCFLRGFLRDNAEFEKALNFAWEKMKDCPKVPPDSSLLASHERLKQAADNGMNTIRSLITTLETADSDERYRAREEKRSAYVHTREIEQAYEAYKKLEAALSTAHSVNNG